jgi:hypothetical protein
MTRRHHPEESPVGRRAARTSRTDPHRPRLPRAQPAIGGGGGEANHDPEVAQHQA